MRLVRSSVGRIEALRSDLRVCEATAKVIGRAAGQVAAAFLLGRCVEGGEEAPDSVGVG